MSRRRDTRFIEAAQQAAARLSQALERAVARDEISLEDLFDDCYVPIPGTDPQQFMTRFTAFTDRVFPGILDPMLDFEERPAFCTCTDRNGYLPTHNRKFSQPQRSDPVWNAANCRNRRIYKDRAALAAVSHTKQFILQTYRRDMGHGNFMLMKDVSVRIFVSGRYWGVLRIGYSA